MGPAIKYHFYCQVTNWIRFFFWGGGGAFHRTSLDLQHGGHSFNRLHSNTLLEMKIWNLSHPHPAGQRRWARWSGLRDVGSHRLHHRYVWLKKRQDGRHRTQDTGLSFLIWGWGRESPVHFSDPTQNDQTAACDDEEHDAVDRNHRIKKSTVD